MLNSLIYRKKTKVQEGQGSYDTWSFEYERPARSAIEELAPANTFYAEGRKVKSTRWTWGCLRLKPGGSVINVPIRRCWVQQTKKRPVPAVEAPCGQMPVRTLMLRMRQVFASTSDRKSRISDDSDDRDPTFLQQADAGSL